MEIFIVPTYYMRLKHMAKDKINYRAQGPVTAMTKQPVSGRANDGGLRIGEMERDSLISHGVSDFLRESMMERSDKYRMAVCNKTGMMAIYNPDKKLFISPMVDGPIKFSGSIDGNNMNIMNVTKHGRDFSIIDVQYSFKLLLQELNTMNMQMRIITDDNIEQFDNMSFSNNMELLGIGGRFDYRAKLKQNENEQPNENIKHFISYSPLNEVNTPDSPPSPLNEGNTPDSPPSSYNSFDKFKDGIPKEEREELNDDDLKLIKMMMYENDNKASSPHTPEYPPSSPKSPEYPPSSPKTPEYPPSSPKSPEYPPSSPKSPEYPPSSPKSPEYPPGAFSSSPPYGPASGGGNKFGLGKMVYYRGGNGRDKNGILQKWKIIKGGNKFITIKRVTPSGTPMNPMNDIKIVQHHDIYNDDDIIGEPQMFQKPSINEDIHNSGNQITFAPVFKINTNDVVDETMEPEKELISTDENGPSEDVSFTEIKPKESINEKDDKVETPLDFSKGLMVVKKV